MVAVAYPRRVRGGTLAPALPVAAAASLGSLASVLAVVAVGPWRLLSAGDLLVDVVVGVTYAPIGVLVLAGRRPSRRLGWLLVGVGVAGALTTVTTCVALLAAAPTTTALVAVHLQSWLWVFAFLPLLTLLPLLYPDGNLLGPPWRLAVVTSATGMVLLAVGSALFPQTFRGTIDIRHPLTNELVSRVVFVAGAALLLLSVVAAMASLVVRLRRSDGLARRQVVVFLVASGAAVASAPVWAALPHPAGTLLQAAAVALLPVAVAVAVTRHRLFDIDLAVCRVVLLASLAACLLGIYLSAFAVLGALLPGGTALTSAFAAAITGVAVHPLGVALRRGVDRLFYGEREDPYAVVRALSGRLRDGVDVRAVPSIVCATAVDSLRLTSAEMHLPGSARPLAASGSPSGPVSRFEMRHSGEVVGSFSVTPRAGELALSPRDDELIAALADQAAPALAALRLTDDLQRSREALVAAREEERRRLRRELHDGVGAVLAGVRLQLDAARELVPDDRAGRMLDAAVSGVGEAVSDVRRITDDLRPAALDQLGLAASLRSLAERARTPTRQVSVGLPDVPALPAAVEVAVYRIAAEALANAVRHSAARSISLCLAVDVGRAVLSVRDDGRGVGSPSPATGSGLGMPSMRERAEEVGGSLSVESGVTGTCVTAVLPW